VSLVFEVVTAVLLTLRFFFGYDQSFGRAVYEGVFHSVSAFNNAGFALYSDSFIRFVGDPWICLPVSVAVVAGALGFPVLFELRRELRRPHSWSLHTKMTVTVSGALLALGTVFVTASEWNNADTFGALDYPQRLLAGFVQAVMPRSGGFNTVDYAQMNEGTLLGTVALMFIGGGPASTAGGIKVTTFIVLFFVIYAEVRGDRNIHAFDRRLDDRAIRQALTVALLSVAAVVTSSLLLLELTSFATHRVLFYATSAFATVGLSTGITADLPTSGKLILIALMFVGRLGPTILVSALVLRERERLYHLPEGRPIIG
jgi:trk system potassium uptake protein